MAQKDTLKQLLNQYFPDNTTGEITEAKVRVFLGEVIDLIPETAGGNLAGTYPNPTIAALAITPPRLAKAVAPCYIGNREDEIIVTGHKTIPIANLFVYEHDKGCWYTKIISGRVHHTPTEDIPPQIVISCQDIPAATFAELPSLVPVFISGDNDWNDWGRVAVEADLSDGYYRTTDDYKLGAQGGYVSLLLAKTQSGYMLVGATERTSY